MLTHKLSCLMSLSAFSSSPTLLGSEMKSGHFISRQWKMTMWSQTKCWWDQSFKTMVPINHGIQESKRKCIIELKVSNSMGFYKRIYMGPGPACRKPKEAAPSFKFIITLLRDKIWSYWMNKIKEILSSLTVLFSLIYLLKSAIYENK